MKVVYKKAGYAGKLMEIDNELDVYNKLVGGWIETFRLTDDILIVLNEEGKINKLPHNFSIPCHGGYYEHIVGDVVIVSLDESDFAGLKEEHIEFLQEIGLLEVILEKHKENK